MDIYKFKKKFKTYDIYFYECVYCSLFIMLHQKVCPYCKNKNVYFDDSLKINEEIENDVIYELKKFQDQLGMKNIFKTAVPKL